MLVAVLFAGGGVLSLYSSLRWVLVVFFFLSLLEGAGRCVCRWWRGLVAVLVAGGGG